jgi:replicative DNA helicase
MSQAEARMVPHDHEAEKAVLGSIMLDAKLYYQAKQILTSNDFFAPPNKLIFKAFDSIAHKFGSSAIDLVTLKDALGHDSEKAGGSAYFSSLIDGLPRYSNITNYAEIVAEKSRLRQVIALCDKVTDTAYTGEHSAEKIIGRAHQRFSEITSRKYDETLRGHNLLGEMRADAKAGSTPVIKTGYTDWDNTLDNYGLQVGDVIIIGGETGGGKTAFCANLAINISGLSGKHVLYIALESTSKKIFARMLRIATGMTKRAMGEMFRGAANGDVEQAEVWSKLCDEYEERGLWMNDSLTTVDSIIVKAEEIKARFGLDVLIVDYVQQLEVPGARNDNDKVKYAMQTMRRAAKRLDIVLIMPGQYRKTPSGLPIKKDAGRTVDDFEGSGYISKEATWVGAIYERDEQFEPHKEEHELKLLDIACLKNRDGIKKGFRAVWDKDTQQIMDVNDWDSDEVTGIWFPKDSDYQQSKGLRIVKNEDEEALV